MNTFPVTVVTPSGEIFSAEQVKKLQVRTRAGEITVLAKHTPLVSVLEIGQMIITTTDETHRLAIFGGFIEIRESGQVIVLADEAERPADIDVDQAKKARLQTQQQLSDHKKQDDRFYELQADLRRSTTRLQVGSSKNKP